MTELLPLLAATFGAGLLGSAHCLGMCAGISGFFAVGATVASMRSQLRLAIAYNVGRILSYALIGAAFAVLGGAMIDVIPQMAGPVRLLSGLLVVVIGLQVAFGWRLFAAVENTGALVWKRIAPRAKGLLPANTVPRAIALGLLWGWLPCGLVYSVLLVATSTGNSVSGALVMLAFGLGTLPAMIASGLGAATLAAFVRRNRLGAGLLIVALGIATLAMPAVAIFGDSEQHEHSQHSATL